MKHGIANESAALTEYVTLLTTQSVRVNFVQSGLILSKSHPFFGASVDSWASLDSWDLGSGN